MTHFAELAGDEQKAWTALHALEGVDEPISPDRRAGLREAIAEARNADLLMTAIAEQMIAQIKMAGVRPNRTLDKLPLKSSAICRPLRAES